MKSCNLLFISTVLFTVLIFGCTRKPSSDCEGCIISVNPQQTERLEPVDCCHKFELLDAGIPIQLGYITNAWIQDQKWIIISNTGAYIFDLNGNLLSELSRKGRASNEYITLWDAWPENDEICLFDSNGQKILQYDINGDFLSSTPIQRPHGEAFQYLYPLSSNSYIGKLSYQGKPTPELALYNRQYEFIRLIGNSHFNTGMRFNYPFSKYLNQILYCDSIHNKIYSIDTAGTVRLRYIIDFETKNLPQDIDDEKLVETILRLKDYQRYALLPANVYEDDIRLIFTFIYNKKKNIGVYDKPTGNVRCLSIESPDDFVLSGIASLSSCKLALFLSNEHSTQIRTINVD